MTMYSMILYNQRNTQEQLNVTWYQLVTILMSAEGNKNINT
jgi:hypothetical protein